MIDSISETILTLTQAADDLPRRRRGRKTHVSTIYRWAAAGCRGVCLETIQIGATRCTSREALQRFFERLSLGNQVGTPSEATRSVIRRDRQSEAAGRKLEKLGA